LIGSNTEILKYESAAKNRHSSREYTLAEAAAANGWISQYAYTWDHNLSQYNIVVPNANNHGDSISSGKAFILHSIDSVSFLRLIFLIVAFWKNRLRFPEVCNPSVKSTPIGVRASRPIGTGFSNSVSFPKN
jgi:hypothetical protein